MWYWNLATRSPRPPIPFLSALALGLSRSPRTVIQCWWVSPEMPQGWRWNRIGTNRTGLYTHVTIWGGNLSNSPASSVQATAFSQPEAITTTPSSLSRTRSTVRFTSNIRKCICSERGREREKDEGNTDAEMEMRSKLLRALKVDYKIWSNGHADAASGWLVRVLMTTADSCHFDKSYSVLGLLMGIWLSCTFVLPELDGGGAGVSAT